MGATGSCCRPFPSLVNVGISKWPVELQSLALVDEICAISEHIQGRAVKSSRHGHDILGHIHFLKSLAEQWHDLGPSGWSLLKGSQWMHLGQSFSNLVARLQRIRGRLIRLDTRPMIFYGQKRVAQKVTRLLMDTSNAHKVFMDDVQSTIAACLYQRVVRATQTSNAGQRSAAGLGPQQAADHQAKALQPSTEDQASPSQSPRILAVRRTFVHMAAAKAASSLASSPVKARGSPYSSLSKPGVSPAHRAPYNISPGQTGVKSGAFPQSPPGPLQYPLPPVLSHQLPTTAQYSPPGVLPANSTSQQQHNPEPYMMLLVQPSSSSLQQSLPHHGHAEVPSLHSSLSRGQRHFQLPVPSPSRGMWPAYSPRAKAKAWQPADLDWLSASLGDPGQTDTISAWYHDSDTPHLDHLMADVDFMLAMKSAQHTGSMQEVQQVLLSAAQAGNATACFRLGLLYESGRLSALPPLPGVKEQQSLGAGTGASSDGSSVATSAGHDAHYAAAAYWYEQGLMGQGVQAAAALGCLRERGLGVPKDLEVAVQLYSWAALQGSALASSNLAGLLAEGRGVDQDVYAAQKLWRQAAGAGSVEAAYHLANSLMQFGTLTTRDHTPPVSRHQSTADLRNAEYWLKRASRAGHSAAALQLSSHLQAQHRHVAAMAELLQAARAGSAAAAAKVGVLLDKMASKLDAPGPRMEPAHVQDPELRLLLADLPSLLPPHGLVLSQTSTDDSCTVLASQALRISGADHEDPTTALLHSKQSSGSQDGYEAVAALQACLTPAEAAKLAGYRWLRHAARAGELDAQHWLANTLWDLGQQSEAMKWWSRAAAQGWATSAMMLGHVAEDQAGCDVQHNWKAAHRSLQAALDHYQHALDLGFSEAASHVQRIHIALGQLQSQAARQGERLTSTGSSAPSALTSLSGDVELTDQAHLPHPDNTDKLLHKSRLARVVTAVSPQLKLALVDADNVLASTTDTLAPFLHDDLE